jgi:hypothetical protein
MPTMIPDRGDDPKRRIIWDIHNTQSGEYMGSMRGGQKAPKKAMGMNLEVSREGHAGYPVPGKRKFK